MLGKAVSSNRPTDFHPSWVICESSRPLTKPHGFTPGPTCGWPYCAVGMHSAVHSSIGLGSKSTSASRMVGLLTPADVSSSRMFSSGSRIEKASTFVCDLRTSAIVGRIDQLRTIRGAKCLRGVLRIAPRRFARRKYRLARPSGGRFVHSRGPQYVPDRSDTAGSHRQPHRLTVLPTAGVPCSKESVMSTDFEFSDYYDAYAASGGDVQLQFVDLPALRDEHVEW